MTAAQTNTEKVVVADDLAKLRFMRGVVDKGAVNPFVVETATRLTRPYRADDYRRRVEAIHRFVRDGIRYQRDPNRREQLADVGVSLRRGYGDCDDKVEIFVAMCRAIGIEADIWPVWREPFNVADPVLQHVQGAARWPASERIETKMTGGDRPGEPPGSGWIVSDHTIAGAELGQDPRSVPRNRETGKLPLS